MKNNFKVLFIKLDTKKIFRRAKSNLKKKTNKIPVLLKYIGKKEYPENGKIINRNLFHNKSIKITIFNSISSTRHKKKKSLNKKGSNRNIVKIKCKKILHSNSQSYPK